VQPFFLFRLSNLKEVVDSDAPLFHFIYSNKISFYHKQMRKKTKESSCAVL
jgi:hypothetical protein